MGRMLRCWAALAATLAQPVCAQTAPPPPAPSHDVVVLGVRSKPSGWREAETSHVIVLSDGSESELVRLTRNLERLHFLLSGLLGRSDAPDNTAKLRVTLIGDVPEFEAMDLRNRRWQQGPFNDLFEISRYYDPREDGAVMASTRVDQRTVIEHTQATPERVLSLLSGMNQTSGSDPATQAAIQGALVGDFATAGMIGAHDLTVGTGARTIDVPAESLLYAGYAQHYLLTYFPAAYPRWYLDGFGQIFASLAVRADHVLEFGRSPRGTSAVLDQFGGYPIGKILDDSYLAEKPDHTRWTPIHAWLLTHFLFFSDTRRPQLRQYLAARAAGADPASAAAVFGDQKQLARELRAYFGARKPYEQVVYPADIIEQPIVRRLSQGQAAFVKGRLELGSRVLIPPAPGPGTDPDKAKAMTKARDQALKDRDHWLAKLREDAGRWQGELGAQLLLAEAECRSGNGERCLAAARKAQALSPDDARARAWEGAALVEQAAAAPAEERTAQLQAARKVIAAANHLDLDAVEPFLAYYASFADVGDTPTVAAIDGLQRAVVAVPNAPATRLALATALAGRGQVAVARQVVLPVADGPYDSPERPAARDLLARTAPAAAP